MPGNFKNEQVLSELQSVENAVIPLCRELQLEGNPQEMHVRNVMQLEASGLQASVRKDQLFVYIFSPYTESWEMEQYEGAPYGQNMSVPKPQLSCLTDSLQGVRLSKSYYIMWKGGTLSYTPVFGHIFFRKKYAGSTRKYSIFVDSG
jgi:hypothetical protein